jgi:hypothetical protein
MPLPLDTSFPLKNTIPIISPSLKGSGVLDLVLLLCRSDELSSTVRTMFVQKLAMYHEHSTENLTIFKHNKDALCMFMSARISESQHPSFPSACAGMDMYFNCLTTSHADLRLAQLRLALPPFSRLIVSIN